MTKIALTAAALLVATGTAFAGSDHYGSDSANQKAIAAPATADGIDHSYTASIRAPATFGGFTIKGDSNQPESGQGIWGR